MGVYFDEALKEEYIESSGMLDSEMARELASYKQMFDNGLISEDEYKDLKANLFRKLGISRSAEGNESTSSVVGLWICNVCNFLGIFINMMISLGVWGDLHSMYEYIMYGYIAGFAFVAVSTPLIIGLSIMLEKKADKNDAIKTAIIGGRASIALTTFLMILSAFL